MTKAIACLFAACIVAGGAVFLHNGNCPFSGNCCTQPASVNADETATASSSISCCDSEESPVSAGCPSCKALSQVSAKKASCCDGEATPAHDVYAAALGGVSVPGSK